MVRALLDAREERYADYDRRVFERCLQEAFETKARKVLRLGNAGPLLRGAEGMRLKRRSGPDAERAPRWWRPRVDSLHVWVVATFAVAQPLYDLLGKTGRVLRLPERGTGGDPRAGRRPERAGAARAGRGNPARRFRRSPHGARGPLHRHGHGSRPHRAARAAAGRCGAGASRWCTRRWCSGAGVAVLYARFGAVRLFFTLLAPAVVVFPVVFVAASPVTPLLVQRGAGAGAATGDDRASGPDRLRGLRRVSHHVADGLGGADRRATLSELRRIGPQRHVVSACNDGRASRPTMRCRPS